jgi:hypothetical protein
MIRSHMFLVPVFALLSAIRRDLFAVSFTTLRDFCRPEFPSPASGLSFERKVQNHTYLAKPCKMKTYKNGATTLVTWTLTKK